MRVRLASAILAGAVASFVGVIGIAAVNAAELSNGQNAAGYGYAAIRPPHGAGDNLRRSAGRDCALLLGHAVGQPPLLSPDGAQTESRAPRTYLSASSHFEGAKLLSLLVCLVGLHW